MTTYTVFRSDDSSDIEGAKLSLEDAAATLLTIDGYQYDIREEDGLSVLYVSRGSVNSFGGTRGLHSCAAGGYVKADRTALLEKIVNSEWHNYRAMTDNDFADMLAAVDE